MSRRPATSLSCGPYLRRLKASDEVRELLRQELLTLPVAAFDRLMARLLLRCGYGPVQVLTEAQGGADLLAWASHGLSPTRTLVQAKQYVSPVSRRFVDELRGAMLRHRASHGLLLATSAFCGPAHRAADWECPLPVRLVDGEELLGLLVSHGLGVRASRSEGFALDREFFAALIRDLSSPVSRPRPAPCRPRGGAR